MNIKLEYHPTLLWIHSKNKLPPIHIVKYGTELLVSLSKDLKTRFGKGFSRSSLQLMRLFYIKYPNFQTSGKTGIRQTLSGKFLAVAGVVTCNNRELLVATPTKQLEIKQKVNHLIHEAQKQFNQTKNEIERMILE